METSCIKVLKTRDILYNWSLSRKTIHAIKYTIQEGNKTSVCPQRYGPNTNGPQGKKNQACNTHSTVMRALVLLLDTGSYLGTSLQFSLHSMSIHFFFDCLGL